MIMMMGAMRFEDAVYLKHRFMPYLSSDHKISISRFPKCFGITLYLSKTALKGNMQVGDILDGK